MKSMCFYPGTGASEENTPQEDDDVYPGGIFNVPIYPGKATSDNWRSEFVEKVFPRLLEFTPDVILISAGFDAHECD